jgi:hypothetical protein
VKGGGFAQALMQEIKDAGQDVTNLSGILFNIVVQHFTLKS